MQISVSEAVKLLRETDAAIQRVSENIAKNPDADGLTLQKESLLKGRGRLAAILRAQSNGSAP